MRTKQIKETNSNKPKDILTEMMTSDDEIYYYECPCGKGKIIEEHDNTPGFRCHDVYIMCNECEEKYELDLSKGVRNWQLVEK